MNEPIRLLLADDHEVTRAGFAAISGLLPRRIGRQRMTPNPTINQVFP